MLRQLKVWVKFLRFRNHMLKVEVVCVGKIKSNGLNQLIEQYCLWLGAFCRIKIVELPKFKGVGEASATTCLKFDEGNFFKKLDLNSFKVALCVEGLELSSEEFARRICKVQNLGFSKVSFLIGGAFGLSELVKKASNVKLSLSRMTLPHGLARLFLVEQIYRAMTILNGGSYHK